MAQQTLSGTCFLPPLDHRPPTSGYDAQNNNNTTTTGMAPLPHNFLSALFSSLARQWVLTRTLKSDNPMDINGILRGTATFVSLRSRGRRIGDSSIEDADRRNQAYSRADEADTDTDTASMVYHEEGEIPSSSLGRMAGMMPMALSGLRWSKKYIWCLRLHEMRGGEMSVWFAKVQHNNRNRHEGETKEEEEADYLFHTFDFKGVCPQDDAPAREDDNCVSPPPPPPPLPASLRLSSRVDQGQDKESEPYTTVLTAYGNHLCVNDMYHTAYAFRVYPTGHVVSWSSRHVVKGPKKNQDIVNLYEAGG